MMTAHLEPVTRSGVTLVILILLIVSGGNGDSEQHTAIAENLLVGRWKIVGERVETAGIEIYWTFTQDSLEVSDGDGKKLSKCQYSRLI